MRWETAAYSVPVLMGGFLAAFLAWTGWRRRTVPGGAFFALLMAGVAVWSCAYSLEMDAGTLGAAVFWSNVLWMGIGIVPTAWLLFVLEHTGHGRRITRGVVALLATAPVLTAALAWTDAWHHLLRRNVLMEDRGDYLLYAYTRGPGFWFVTGYSYLLLLAGTVLLLTSLLRSSRPYRRQVLALSAAAVLPWIVNVFHLAGLSPMAVDVTPFGFLGSGALIAWALFRLGLLDLVPVAHEAVIDSMADGVIVLDALSRVADLNPAAVAIVNRPPSEAVGRPVAELLTGRPDLLERYGSVLEAREEISLMRGEEQCWYELRISPLQGRDGSTTGRLVVLRDVTERRHAEEALRHAQKMESLGVLSRGVAHTFNNVLAVILGNASLAEHKVPSGTPAREHIAKITIAAERAARIVREMMTFSGGDPISARLLDVSSLIHDSLDLLKAIVPARIHIEPQLGSDLPPILADPRHVQEAVIHVLANAAEAIGDNAGVVSLRTALVDGSRESGPWIGDEVPPGAFVAIEVADDGPGIPLTILPRIFDPFFTTHFEGRGLGLAAVRGILQSHGGGIRVRTEPGQGSTFRLFFPARVGGHAASDSQPDSNKNLKGNPVPSRAFRAT